MLDHILEARLSAATVTAHRPAYEPAILAAALQISLQQSKLLCLLLSSPLTTLQTVQDRTALEKDGRRKMVFRLRDKLKRWKVRIISHPGLGYSIPAEDRDRILAAVEKFKGR